MADPENLDYASFLHRTRVRNTQTGEQGVITGAANALVGITLTSGPDEGEELALSPSEVITYWRKTN